MISFKALKRFVTVSLFGLNLSCGKVSQGGKLEIEVDGKYDFNSAVNSSAFRVELVTNNNGCSFDATAASSEWIAAGATRG
ncbi:unannotated protein [freshwater metagenome]|uniref:Unannotated protein n=1 Tax=freshwater metagenome TaxID=449393 RepID=A0A6J6EV60_9ZZZZ